MLYYLIVLLSGLHEKNACKVLSTLAGTWQVMLHMSTLEIQKKCCRTSEGAGECFFYLGKERIVGDFLQVADKSQSQFINLLKNTYWAITVKLAQLCCEVGFIRILSLHLSDEKTEIHRVSVKVAEGFPGKFW